jgi:hypothetical protein
VFSWAILIVGIVYAWAAWAWADDGGLALWQLPVAIYLALPFLIAATAVESGRGSAPLAGTRTRSRTAYGPTFGYNSKTTFVRFEIYLSAESDAVGLAYQVCA